MIHLISIFKDSESIGNVQSEIYRLGIYKILQRSLREYTLSKSKCNKKIMYLNALKIFQLRCLNRNIAQRMQY